MTTCDRRRFLARALKFGAIVSCDSAAAVPLSAPSLGQRQHGAGSDNHLGIESFLSSILPKGSSGTLAAALDGEMVTCHGWGMSDREAGVAARCDTVYDIMSMTKQFTATAVLKLEMQGLLRVSGRIGQYFDDVPDDKRDITVRHLLSHTSGLVDTLGDDYEPLTRDAMISRTLRSRLQSRPGEAYLYSNVGYSMLAALIEFASGMRFEEYLAEHLFTPAGMSRTGYVLPDWQRANVAVEYNADSEPQGSPFEHPWADDGPYWNLRGNGGMLSTAQDMVLWHRAIEGNGILDQTSRLELLQPRVREEPNGDTFYGYGWVVQDTDAGRVLWHNGGNAWTYGEITWIPEAGLFVFWITNQAHSETANWDFYELGSIITEGVVERLVQA